jgi:outer membrane receptor protein involved in Fe transport
VRTPSLLENGANIDVSAAPGPQGLPIVIAVVGQGVPEAERLWASEIGYRRQWSTVSLDVSAFRNSYAHLSSLAPSTPEFVAAAIPFVRVPYLIADDLQGTGYGVEAAGTWRVRRGWTLTAGYTFLALDLTSNGAEQDVRFEWAEDDSPRHQVLLRSLASFGSRWEADATIHALGSSDEHRVPAYARVDARTGCKVSDQLKISVAALNLLDARHAEFLSVSNEEITQPRRSVVLQTVWTF